MSIRFLIFTLTFFGAFGCSRPQQPVEYIAKLHTPGGDIQVPLIVDFSNSKSPGFVLNQSDTTRFTSLESVDDSLLLSFGYFDSHIKFVRKENGALEGRWWKMTSGSGIATLPFSANKGTMEIPKTTSTEMNGEWSVKFKEGSSGFKAKGMFNTDSGFLDGSFLTETGDFRFLRGTIEDQEFEIGTFDAAHAFYFKGKIVGESIIGEFWSANTYYSTFFGVRGDGDLDDATTMTKINPNQPFIEFSFPDPTGKIVSNTDDRFKDKAVLLYVFGTWCPNCADVTRLLRDLYEEYKDKNLEIVGLAHEYTDDWERDVEMVGRYKERFDIPWTILIAGNSSKREAAKRLSFTEEIVSYPTSFFADKSHKICYTHTGIKGPGTGIYYQLEIERFKKNLDDIVE